MMSSRDKQILSSNNQYWLIIKLNTSVLYIFMVIEMKVQRPKWNKRQFSISFPSNKIIAFEKMQSVKDNSYSKDIFITK